MLKLPETKIRNYSERIDEYLNRIYLIKDEEIEYESLIDLLENIEGWRSDIDEIELSVISNHVFNSLEYNNYDIDNESKEIIIF
jgi:hypothetical protein